ncbi:MAG: hypothetical protein V4574_00895 [Pseudomonadota bacterium]
MSKHETVWPDSVFFIQSCTRGSNLVLASADGTNVAFQHRNGSPDQMWRAVKDVRGSAYLQHIASGRMLRAKLLDNNPLRIVLVDMGSVDLADRDESNVNQQWRIEILGDNRGIVCSSDWNLRLRTSFRNQDAITIGMYNHGEADERWIIAEELGQSTIVSTTYDLDKAKVFNRKPTESFAKSLDNRQSSVANKFTEKLVWSDTKVRTFTRTTTHTTAEIYTQNFGVKGGFDKVVEVSAGGSAQESTTDSSSISEGSSDSTTRTREFSLDFNVPAGKKYSAHTVVFVGEVEVPYRSKMTFRSSFFPSVAEVEYTVEGIFRGVNTTEVWAVVLDVTDNQPSEVKREPVPLPES